MQFTEELSWLSDNGFMYFRLYRSIWWRNQPYTVLQTTFTFWNNLDCYCDLCWQGVVRKSVISRDILSFPSLSKLMHNVGVDGSVRNLFIYFHLTHGFQQNPEFLSPSKLYLPAVPILLLHYSISSFTTNHYVWSASRYEL